MLHLGRLGLRVRVSVRAGVRVRVGVGVGVRVRVRGRVRVRPNHVGQWMQPKSKKTRCSWCVVKNAA